MRELLQSSKNWEDFTQNLDKALHSYLSQTYPSSEEITSRLSLQVEKNLATQEFNQTMIPQPLLDQLQNPAFINNNPDIKKLFFVLDFSSEHSSSQDHITLRLAFEKIQKLSSSADTIAKIKDPLLQNFLKKYATLANSPTPSIKDRTSTMLDFLNLFTKKNLNTPEFSYTGDAPSDAIINSSDLNAFLDAHLDDKPLDQSKEFKSLFSESFTNKYLQTKEALLSHTDKEEVANIEMQLEAADFQFAYA